MIQRALLVFFLSDQLSDFQGDPTDAIEEAASGSSGLQYNGDGYWQFNWKTLKNNANTCRTMYICSIAT
jgi:hypothetical protein